MTPEGKPHTHYVMYFVPKAKIRQALIDFQWHREAWVKDCFYLRDDKKFSVLVAFTHRYPYLENKFEDWERDESDKEEETYPLP